MQPTEVRQVVGLPDEPASPPTTCSHSITYYWATGQADRVTNALEQSSRTEFWWEDHQVYAQYDERGVGTFYGYRLDGRLDRIGKNANSSRQFDPRGIANLDYNDWGDLEFMAGWPRQQVVGATRRNYLH